VCLGICSCGACRKSKQTTPYQPKGTYLGASTKHVADPRSVETLVDFSRGNLSWFKRDQKRKAPEENGDIVDAAQQDPIDPNLEQASGFTAVNASPRNEGRSLPTASTNVDDSNTIGSVQAELRDHDAEVTSWDPSPALQPQATDPARARSVEESDGGRRLETDFFFRGTGVNGAFSANANLANLSNTSSNFSSRSYVGPTCGDSGLQHPGALSGTGGSAGALGNVGVETPYSGGFSSLLQPFPSLEDNPLAFIAAAGLMQLPGGGASPATSPEWPQRGLPLSTTAAPHELHTPAPVERQPSSLLPPPPPPPPAPPAAPPSAPPRMQSPAYSPEATPPPRPIPRRPKVKPQEEFINYTPNSIGVEAQLGSDWVRKAKIAAQLAKNLKKKKSLIVTLRVPVNRFRVIMENVWEKQKLVSDLVYLGPGHGWSSVHQAQSVSHFEDPFQDSPPAKLGRGRPRKSEMIDLPSDDSDLDIADDFATPSAEDKAKSAARRNEAYLRRKKEEEEAKAAFLAAQEERDRNNLKVPVRNRVKHKEVFDVLRQRAAFAAAEPPPPETEQERIAREAEELIARENREEQERIARENREEQERIAREAREEELRVARAAALARRAAQDEERRRLRAAAKAEREALRRQEKERRRKEADRQAKLAAAGLLAFSDVEEYISSSTGSDDSSSESEGEEQQQGQREQQQQYFRFVEEEQPEQPNFGFVEGDQREQHFFAEDTPVEDTSLIPAGRNFAVVVTTPPDSYFWREDYECFPEIVVSPSPPAPPVKRGRGRPRKNPLPLAGAPIQPAPPAQGPDPLPVTSTPPQPVKRGPGRPKKTPLSLASPPGPPGPPGPPAPPAKRGRGRPPKNPLPVTSTPQPVKRGPGRPRKIPLPPSDGVPSTRHKSAECTDQAYKPNNPLRTAISPEAGRERRKSAVAATAKFSFQDEEEELRQVRVKQRKLKRVEVKPGKWAEVEITESEDDDDELPEFEPMVQEDTMMQEVEEEEDVRLDGGDEYEMRWKRHGSGW
jgi:hypothetical protein